MRFLKTKYSIYLLILLVFVAFDIFNFTSIRIGPDCGYYLSVSRDMVLLGKLPLLDTHSRYAPLGYLFYSIPFIVQKDPQYSTFLLLNLVLFVVTALIFLKTLRTLVKSGFWVFFIYSVFLYNFHGITYDIKLENLLLFLNISIIYLLNKFVISHDTHKSSFYVRNAILIGLLCGTAFLTKQFAGLSLVFVIIILFWYTKHRRIVNSVYIGVGFLSVIFLYAFIYWVLGGSLNYLILQTKGELAINCIGSNEGGGQVYGERKFINLIIALKYYKLNLLVWFSLFFAMLALLKKKIKFSLMAIVKFVLLILLMQIPFYFQVFPHYTLFGLPFVFYILCIFISNHLENVLSISNDFLSWVPSLLSIFFILYSYYFLFRNFDSKEKISSENQEFSNKLNSVIPRGSNVFLINNRKLWFLCHWVTPTPKTIGYAFVGRDCFELAMSNEEQKVNEFWVADMHPFDSKLRYNGFKRINSIHLVSGSTNVYACRFLRQ